MSSIKKLEIFIINEHEYYIPGTWLKCVLQMRVGKPTNARAIRLKWKGKERTRWTEMRWMDSVEEDGQPGRTLKTFSLGEKQRIFDASFTLWGQQPTEYSRMGTC